jgi:hypothetical protein
MLETQHLAREVAIASAPYKFNGKPTIKRGDWWRWSSPVGILFSVERYY